MDAYYLFTTVNIFTSLLLAAILLSALALLRIMTDDAEKPTPLWFALSSITTVLAIIPVTLSLNAFAGERSTYELTEEISPNSVQALEKNRARTLISTSGSYVPYPQERKPTIVFTDDQRALMSFETTTITLENSWLRHLPTYRALDIPSQLTVPGYHLTKLQLPSKGEH